MILQHLFIAALAPAAYLPWASASSFDRNPLNTVENVLDASVDTSSHRISAFQSFDLSFFAFKRRIRFSLEPNHDIIPQGAQVSYLGHNGEVVRTEPIDRHLHKVYKGDVWSQNVDGSFQNVGHARVLVHKDGKRPVFEGAFTINHDHHHISLRDKYMQTKHPMDPLPPHRGRDAEMVVFRDSDIRSDWLDGHEEFKKRSYFPADSHVSGPSLSCESDNLEFNMDVEHPVLSGAPIDGQSNFWSVPMGNLFGKRQIDTSTGTGNSAGVNLVSTIGQTSGCPTTRKVALVGVATDCTYTASFADQDAVKANVIAQINSASAVYEKTFQISLGLQNLTISPKDCPSSPPPATPWNTGCDSQDIQGRLNLFSQWRGKQADSNSHWTLLTTCNSGPAVGLAWLGQACVVSTQARNGTSGGVQTVAGANVVAKTSTEWQVIAHETGHTFGAVHDCTSQTCSDGTSTQQMCCPLSSGTCDAGQKFIMNPSTAQGITAFSQCSIGNICAAIGRGSVKTSCFSSNKAVPLLTAAKCGNGIVEQGEECDCGGTAGCGSDACCDPNTCKFKNGAVCDDTNDECCSGCKFASNGTVCRASTGVCDPAETCNGLNATCPADKSAPDGQGCGSGLNCASGHCTSRNQQCKTLMGSYSQGNDTYACDSISCTISCSSPSLPNACMTMQQNFLDGTQCGGGGFCSNGACKGSSFIKEVKSWIDQHKGLVIGIACGAGAIVLLLIGSCIWNCRKRRRAPTTAWPGTNRRGPSGPYASGAGYQQTNSRASQQWKPQHPQQSSWRYG
ncbi:ADAM family of metalloprotease ADM-B [Microthyrium microscopicum]|uniref:Disintegrin and metalloproteinase domain-containing protein B n=1 Tax=Microthyrium microscopicum TaxID=703497 RepID=A0A6A6TVD4_9PEZI|nr:ADAM family of metalloprotease ADM-B [Microthyrium microscopicum]